jgi:lipid-A-disaccharide synthase
MKKVLIMSGEASGDLHGANLVRELRKADPALQLYGVGSREMRNAGVRLLADASEISVVGITAVLTHVRKIYRVFAKLKRFLKHERPDILVLIDFPDFNIMLGKAAHKLGIPVVYYISPQVWVWRKGRIKTIARLVKAMLVVFPFEVQLYEQEGVDVRFVGHPLADIVRSDLTQEQAKDLFTIGRTNRVVALLPGSRRSEIVHLLPDMLGAARILKRLHPDLQFLLPVAATLDSRFVRSFIERSGVRVRMVEGRAYDALRASDAALVASGTATLETGIMGVPMAIVYRISPLNYFIMTKLVPTVEHIGLVNIVAGKRIVPELVQHGSTPDAMADAINRILADPAYAQQVKGDLARMRERLGEAGASRRAAAIVAEFIKQAG